jgi:hypothetical protein
MAYAFELWSDRLGRVLLRPRTDIAIVMSLTRLPTIDSFGYTHSCEPSVRYSLPRIEMRKLASSRVALCSSPCIASHQILGLGG